MLDLTPLYPNAHLLRFAEPTEDGEVYEALHLGRLVRADSLPLLLAALQENLPRSSGRCLRLAA